MVLFIVDGRSGLAPQDRVIAEQLRKTGRKIILVVNKTEGMASSVITAEFHELGLGEPCAISASHGDNVNESGGTGVSGFSPAARGRKNGQTSENCYRGTPQRWQINAGEYNAGGGARNRI